MPLADVDLIRHIGQLEFVLIVLFYVGDRVLDDKAVGSAAA